MTAKPELRIILCAPRGFCAGVVRAIDVVERALQIYGAPVYVRHEIVHNKYVVDSLKAKGVVFIKELSEAPAGAAPVIFSAHGVAKSVPEEARARNLFTIDATCPLVTKVHREAQVHFKRGRHVILIGHVGHPEVIGTIGQLPTGAATLVSSAAEVEALRFEPQDRARLCHADHAFGRRHARNRRGAEAALSRRSTRRRSRTSATPPPTGRRRSSAPRRWSRR